MRRSPLFLLTIGLSVGWGLALAGCHSDSEAASDSTAAKPTTSGDATTNVPPPISPELKAQNNAPAVRENGGPIGGPKHHSGSPGGPP